jgi:hypothetical protein
MALMQLACAIWGVSPHTPPHQAGLVSTAVSSRAKKMQAAVLLARSQLEATSTRMHSL